MAEYLPEPIAYTPDEIVRLVGERELSMEALRLRMEEDYHRYLLEWNDARELPKDHYKFISNEPRTYADRIMALLVGSALTFQVPFDNSTQPEREAGHQKERFIKWALNRADTDNRHALQPSLRQQGAFYITLRGWYAGRVMLYKDEQGKTQSDIALFDPLHTFFRSGNGSLRWLCYRMYRTAEEIEDEFGILVAPDGKKGSSQGIPVYYWYDTTHTAVVINGEWAGEPQPHGHTRVPGFVGYIGSMPVVQEKSGQSDRSWMKEVGESVYASLRHTYDAVNRTVSDRMTLVSRSVDPGFVLKSETGTKTLKENPFAERQGLGLRIGETLEPLQLQEMARDTDLLLGHLLGEVQRGSLPHSTYGDQPQTQISGYAISLLQQGLGLKVQDWVQALSNLYKEISDLLCEQFMSGRFEAVQLGAYTTQPNPKHILIPQMLEGATDLEVKVRPQLPKDQAASYSIAQLAKELGIISNRTILDTILEIDDPDGELSKVKEELADQASPVAVLVNLIQTAIKQERYELVPIYQADLNRLITEMAMPPQAGQPAGGQSNSQGSPPKPRGLPTGVSPTQAQGYPQSRPGRALPSMNGAGS